MRHILKTTMVGKPMSKQWKAYLASRRIEFNREGGVRMAEAPREPDCALVDLSELGFISVKGPDAADFLQGQVTNDVRELSETHTQYSSLCSPKGRMLATFRVVRIDGAIYLQLPASILDAVLRRLRMFVMRSQVALADASDDLIAIGLSGNCAPALLEARLGALPDRENAMVRSRNLLAIRMPGPAPRYQVLGPEPEMEPLWDTLASEATVMGFDYWALTDIRAGVPTIYPETSDAFVPQMANMQLIDGVSFTKGCYTGQEVVARMQYLGKTKRRMYLAQVEALVTPRPGDELQAPTSRSEQAAGRVVDARLNAEGRWELLAVLELAAADSGEVRIGADGPLLSLKEPPYGLPSES
jgi:folate-binding protein YgfZ